MHSASALVAAITLFPLLKWWPPRLPRFMFFVASVGYMLYGHARGPAVGILVDLWESGMNLEKCLHSLVMARSRLSVATGGCFVRLPSPDVSLTIGF